MATTATTTPAADLEPGDRFYLPSSGRRVEFVRWGRSDDHTFAFVIHPNGGDSSRSHLAAVSLDPANIVNLEA